MNEQELRQSVMIRHALLSQDPMVKQALDRLFVTTQLAHGEEIAADIRNEIERREHSERLTLMAKQRHQRSEAIIDHFLQNMRKG